MMTKTLAKLSGDEIIERAFFELFQDKFKEKDRIHFTNLEKLEEQAELINAFINFVLSLTSWKSFITLTFKEPVGVDVALAKVKSLVALLNKRMYGKHYTRLVGHSYFSYAMGMEFQRRDVIHFHLLVDKSVDFQLIHSWWGACAGFAYIEEITDRSKVVNYVCKYVLKGGEVWLYKSKRDLMPRKRPIWWTS